jgi:hypothetical protein
MRSAPLLLICLLSLSTCCAEVSRDTAALRADALKAEQPCVLIVNSDVRTLCGLVTSAEVNLLPSMEFKGFVEKTRVAAVRSSTPEAKALSTEFRIETINAWFVILDAKGETIDRFCPESDTECSRKSAQEFAPNIVARMKKGLAETSSLQELERRWRKQPSDLAARKDLVARLEKMALKREFPRLCKAALSDPSLPAGDKVAYELQVYFWDTKDSVFFEEKERAAFLNRGEEMLSLHADHALAAELCDTLGSQMKDGFDAVGRWAECIERLKKLTTANPSDAFKACIERMKRLREYYIEDIRDVQKLYPNDEGAQGYFAAQLGDAKKTVEILSKPQYAELYEAVLKKARARLAEAAAKAPEKPVAPK